MAIVSNGTLKGYFKAGAIPTESNFSDLIDTAVLKGVDGKVGIGPNPSSVLSISDSTTELSSSVYSPILRTFITQELDPNPGKELCLASFGVQSGGGMDTSALSVRARRNGNGSSWAQVSLGITFDTMGQELANNGAIWLAGGNGAVGIGTANPAQKLDVAGDVGIQAKLYFSQPRNWQMINLYDTRFGIGTQKWTTYCRTGNHFAVFKGGEDSDGDNRTLDPGKDGTTLMAINGDSGNLGIGTNSPNAKLEVNLAGAGGWPPTDPNTNFGLARFVPPDSNYDLKLNAYFIQSGLVGFQFSPNGNVGLCINAQGNVGIGTKTPSKGFVEIQGHIGFSLPTPYGYLDTKGSGSLSGNDCYCSLYASERIICYEFDAVSDIRIKRIIGQSDSRSDLATLLRLRITDYTMVDTIAKGTRPHKKVIGQEVREVFPQAVSTLVDVVPDIYRLAALADGWIQLTSDLKPGERVQLITADQKEVFEVTEVSAEGFRVAGAPVGEQVFVYGREVNDFHVVDYEAIATLNVSATQELCRQLEAQRATIKSLQVAQDQLAKEVAALKNRLFVPAGQA